MTWKTAFLFMVLATLIVILVGWLTSIGILPISQMINYSDAGLRFIRVWILLAIAIGLIVPTITFVIWFKYPEIRKIFGLYLLVLIIQIVTEQIVSIWLPSLVVIIGTLYTAFRVWQLWHEQQFIKSTDFVERGNFRIISSVLWLLLLFWSSNLIMLLTLSWPSIL
ncbi:hypothetical protein [Nostoc sp.]|uniref:hypothetical protein n=1 Tax=Nostoc sp. TaxID=1180 RepID=UPI002FFB1350